MARFILVGFDQSAGVRRYRFLGVTSGKRAECTVRVELALMPSYGIRIQELPLLCRELLEQQGAGEEAAVLTYTEANMSAHAVNRATARAAAALKKKQVRKPFGNTSAPA